MEQQNISEEQNIPQKIEADEVQIFNVEEAIEEYERIPGRIDMAKSPKSYVALFKTPPRGGETHIHQHPDSDQILFVLKGNVTVEGLSGKYLLKPNQGVLIPAGVHYGFTNETEEYVLFLSMRTESPGGRRVAYVENVPSDVRVRIPAEALSGQEVRRSLYAYCLNRTTFGIATVLLEEWNKGSLLRMNCAYETDGNYIVARLPKRLVGWYKLEGLSESDYRIVGEADKLRVRVDIEPLVRRQLGR
jgi:mannose-6-phosphate isomerase-like protein (cupin superfamily)